MPSPSMKSTFLSESEAVEALQLQPGFTVAEIGLGQFVAKIAREVGPEGHIFPADAKRNDRLPDGCCDRVLMANRWAELDDPLATLAESARLLAEGGRLVIIERHRAEPGGINFPELIQTLEHNHWDVHRHGDAGAHCYYVEVGVSDQSCQS